jgi:hypothetical protein
MAKNIKIFAMTAHRYRITRFWAEMPPHTYSIHVKSMIPKARGLAQHGGPPGWLEESDPAGCDFVLDGRFIPSALTGQTTYPGLELIYY